MKDTITKTFQSRGKWIEKRTQAEVLLCVCGGKYLKTRRDQTTCLACVRVQAVVKK